MFASDPANLLLAFPNVITDRARSLCFTMWRKAAFKSPSIKMASTFQKRNFVQSFIQSSSLQHVQSIKIFAKSLLMQSNLWERRIKLSSIKNWYPNVILLALEYVFCHANNQIFTAITSAVNPVTITITITITSPLSNWISPKRLGCFRPTHPQRNLSPTHCPSSIAFLFKRMIVIIF